MRPVSTVDEAVATSRRCAQVIHSSLNTGAQTRDMHPSRCHFSSEPEAGRAAAGTRVELVNVTFRFDIFRTVQARPVNVVQLFSSAFVVQCCSAWLINSRCGSGCRCATHVRSYSCILFGQSGRSPTQKWDVGESVTCNYPQKLASREMCHTGCLR